MVRRRWKESQFVKGSVRRSPDARPPGCRLFTPSSEKSPQIWKIRQACRRERQDQADRARSDSDPANRPTYQPSAGGQADVLLCGTWLQDQVAESASEAREHRRVVTR